MWELPHSTVAGSGWKMGHPFRGHRFWSEGGGWRDDKSSLCLQRLRPLPGFVKVVVLCCLESVLAHSCCSPALGLPGSEDDELRFILLSNGRKWASSRPTSDKDGREVRATLPSLVLPDVSLGLTWGPGASVFSTDSRLVVIKSKVESFLNLPPTSPPGLGSFIRSCLFQGD